MWGVLELVLVRVENGYAGRRNAEDVFNFQKHVDISSSCHSGIMYL